MVELCALEDDDVAWLAGVLERYEAETASPVAARALAGLDRGSGGARLFVKVVPADYRRALEAKRIGQGVLAHG